MNLGSYRRRTSDEGIIMFPPLECWNPMTKVATIAAQVSGKRVLCRISNAVLQKKFRSAPDAPMKAVSDNRSRIEAAARKLIENDSYEADGSIAIRYKDL